MFKLQVDWKQLETKTRHLNLIRGRFSNWLMYPIYLHFVQLAHIKWDIISSISKKCWKFIASKMLEIKSRHLTWEILRTHNFWNLKKLLKMKLSSCTFNWILKKNLQQYFLLSMMCKKRRKFYHRYRPIRKLKILVLIGIGRKEKKLIDRTLVQESRHENFIIKIELFIILE